MDDNNNKRLDNLFNQAKNEPSKISYQETQKQFLKTTTGVSSSIAGKGIANFLNLKISIMIATLSVIAVGSIFYINSLTGDKTTELVTETIPIIEEYTTDEQLINKASKEVVTAHMEKVNQLPSNLKEVYQVKLELASKLKMVGANDSLKRHKIEREKSERKSELLDTSYRFPNLNYEERRANEKQKTKMLKDLAKFDKKKYAFIPNGSITQDGKAISIKAFYMQTTEVTNLEYRTFLFDLLIQGRFDAFLLAKPDQSRWVKDYPYAFNKPMQMNYFSHAAYDYYPVVGVSRQGVEMYCKWLSIEVNKKYSNKTPIPDVRIPTDYEWMHAATGGLKNSPYPWGGPYLRNAKGAYLANFMPKKGHYNEDGAFHTAKANSYHPNGYGLFCMAGNVAEMVYYFDENMLPGTKGGSWTSAGQELQIMDGKDRFKKMIKPSADIGFRPVIAYLGKSSYSINDMTVTPPGTVKIDPDFYADETEITNFSWLEYVTWMKDKFGEGSPEYFNALPDTTVWRKILKTSQPYEKHYFKHPAYRAYPVVGVSYKQAVAYCKWRTNRVKELYDLQKEAGDKKNIYPTGFEYRLPTKKEWERLARAGYSEKTQKKLNGKYKGHSEMNAKRGKGDTISLKGVTKDAVDILAPVQSYWPNRYGMYNLFGNTAEMVMEKGIAKGGSWIHDGDKITVERDDTYEEQNHWLGFRCVFVRKKKN